MANEGLDELLCFLGDPIFQIPVRTFMDEHCIIFDPSMEISEDHKQVHAKYKKLFDTLLESFCHDMKLTLEQAFKGINKMASIPDLKEVFGPLFEQCQAATDFTTFCQVMIKRNILVQEQVLRFIMETTGQLPDSLSMSDTKGSSDDKQEQDLLKQVMQQSKKDADREQRSQQKEDEMLKKTLEISKKEQEALEVQRKKIEEDMKRMALEEKEAENSWKLPAPAVYAPPSARQSTTAAAPAVAAVAGTSSKPPPPKSQLSPPPKEHAPLFTPTAKPPAGDVAASAPPPVAAAATGSSVKAVSSTDAASAWLKEAQAEANSSSAHAAVAASLSKLSPEELKKRQEYLREQRDKLLAMKKTARENQLGVASQAQPGRPVSARAARTAMREAPVPDPEDEKKLAMRRAIADRLKQEVIGKH